MDQGFGQELPPPHAQRTHRPAARHLVVVATAETVVARLFLDSREQVAEFDAASEEITAMTKGLSPVKGARGKEWDQALAGHSAEERADALVYELEV